MGREVRMVPANWQHPRYPADHWEARLRGRYIPLHRSGFASADAEWTEERAKWVAGFVRSYSGEPWKPREVVDGQRFTEWAGSRPSPDDYMPEWPATEATHLMMYEDTSEGTPISPAFAAPEDLARWLADTGASAFGGDTATYDQWLSTIQRGWAPSAIMAAGVLESGVAGLAASPISRATAPAELGDSGTPTNTSTHTGDQPL